MRDADFPWLILFAAIALVSVRISKRWYGSWFSPVSMYVGMNALSMAGYHLKWLAYHEVGLTTHLILLVSMFMFVLGAQNALGRGFAPERLPESPTRDYDSLERFFYLTVILSTVGWIVASAILLMRFGLGSLINNIWMLQSNFQMQFIGYLNMIGILVMPIYVIRHLSGRARSYDLLFVASSLFGLLLSGIKGYLVASSVCSVVVWSAMRPSRFRPAYLLGVLGVLLAFFIAYTARVDIFVADQYAAGETSQKFSMFQRPYLYVTASWPAFESIIAGVMPDPPRWGFVTLQPLWKLLGGLGVLEAVPHVLPFSTTGVAPHNVYAFAGEVFWDWGWFGCAGLSWLLGYLSTRLWLRARRCHHWGHVLVYGVVGYGVFMSVFAYFFRFNMMLMLLYTYLAAFVVPRGGVFVDRRRRV